MTKPELYVLDLVGTVIEDDGRVERVFKETMAERGIEDPGNLVSKMMGCSKQEVFLSICGDTAVAANLFEYFQMKMNASYQEDPARPLVDIDKFTYEMNSHGRVVMNTGFDQRVAKAALRGVMHSWHIVSVSDVWAGRPAPYMIHRAMEIANVHNVRKVCVVGDTINDMMAGWNAGASWLVGVCTGHMSREQWVDWLHSFEGSYHGAPLGSGSSFHIADSIADIPELLSLKTT